jgi:transposase
MSATRRVFPETFKREAVDRVVSSGLTIAKVAAELGLNETVLRRWVVRLSSEATGTARRLELTPSNRTRGGLGKDVLPG